MSLPEILDLTKQLIAFRSTADNPAQRAACAEAVAAYLEDAGIACESLENQGVHSIVALPEPGRTRVLLLAHMDVVAAPDALFTPVERDGQLYGRGAVDDKYAVALALVLMKKHLARLRSSGKAQADLPFGLLITGDEEQGGRLGAQEALKHIRAEFCIALDGGGLETIVVKEKGVLRLRLAAHGQAAHGARPWMGDNAIDTLVDDIAALRPLFALDAPEHWNRTMNVGVIHGGEVVNMVPAEAYARLDIRYTENDDPQALLADIRALAKSEVILERHDTMFDSGASPLLDKLLAFAPQARPGKAHGASDARFLSAQGIPGVVWGADGDSSQHSENEHLNVDSLKALHRCLDGYLKALGE